MTSGDILVCKRTCCFENPWDVYFIRNKSYIIFKIDEDTKTISIFSEDNDFYDFSFTRKKLRDYVYDYFHTQAEYREIRINEILE